MKRPRVTTHDVATSSSRVGGVETSTRDAAVRELLAWDIGHGLDEVEEVVSAEFGSAQKYVESWIGAWLCETRASTVAELERGGAAIEKVELSVVASGDPKGAFARVACAGGLRNATESDLVELKKGSTWKALGLVVQPARRDPTTTLLVAKARVSEMFAGGACEATARVVTSLTPALRELEAVANFGKLPEAIRVALLEDKKEIGGGGDNTRTRRPRRLVSSPEVETAASAREGEAALSAAQHARLSDRCGPGLAARIFAASNRSQVAAIAASAAPFCSSNDEEPAFTLIKGPPGTGKTATTAKVLNAIHVRQFQEYYGAVRRAAEAGEVSSSGGAVARLLETTASDPETWLARLREARPRILVCAPSNVAVDNVVERLVRDDAFVGGNGKPYSPDVARVGKKSCAGSVASLDARVEEVLSKTKDWLEEHVALTEKEAFRASRDAEKMRRRLRLFAFEAPVFLPARWEARVQPARPVPGARDAPYLYYVDHRHKITKREPPRFLNGAAMVPLESCSPEVDLVVSDLHAHLETWTRATARLAAYKCALARYRPDARTGGVASNETVRRALAAKLLDDAEIVCATLHGAGHSSVGDSRRFKAIVVDEAANALETATLVALANAETTERSPKVVLVGDPNQLAATRFARRNPWAAASLFERLEAGGAAPCVLLDTQYRMHPVISRFASQTFYDARLLDGSAALGRATAPEYAWRRKDGALGPLVFLDLKTSVEDAAGTSRANRAEARLAARVHAAFLGAFRDANPETVDLPDVALVTFYREQLKELEKAVTSDHPRPEINTVDAYQGREKDVVILSCVRANADGVGFLRDARRLNVALTRAKYACIVIGRRATLETDARWRSLLDYATANSALFEVPDADADLRALRPVASSKPSRRRNRNGNGNGNGNGGGIPPSSGFSSSSSYDAPPAAAAAAAQQTSSSSSGFSAPAPAPRRDLPKRKRPPHPKRRRPRGPESKEEEDGESSSMGDAEDSSILERGEASGDGSSPGSSPTSPSAPASAFVRRDMRVSNGSGSVRSDSKRVVRGGSPVTPTKGAISPGRSKNEPLCLQWPSREEYSCCGLVRVRRVGMLYVVSEWTRSDGRKARLYLGPYWHFLLMTLALLTCIASFVYGRVVPDDWTVVRVVGLTLTVLSFVSLACTSLSDPGIFPRYFKRLEANWTYSEYAHSFRPPGTIFCQECQVLIEEYNHFCPWSGTAIGKGNEVRRFSISTHPLRLY
ncbi:hypothetical protein CTAYLR_002058 [Chrysophaeum taylorii]|uniref:Uncharacterized protein n=1 Tax=Chrysophaeum taylorii TaxID=2483200 RepID=A0AAD7XRA3_9STRA|nr:hypothetical protein CTAYLR_002058 [Chrysophaeum taylorii]